MITSPLPSPSALFRLEHGGVMVIVALALIPIGIGGLMIAVDLGMMFDQKAKLQNVADAASLAAAQEIPQQTSARSTAVAYAGNNPPYMESVVDPDEVVLGHWDEDDETFAPGGNPTNAARVIARRNEERDNALPLLFAPFFGHDFANITASAIAVAGGGTFSRFIIDDEMFDSDVPAIEDLANDLGWDSDELITDLDDDGFIQLVDEAPGQVLELPTGQVGDEGMFDMNHDSFEFKSADDFTDFLNWNENGTWREELIDKEEMDPLVGVSTVSDGSRYSELVTSSCQVSPLKKSDVSALDPVGGEPAVNMLGERRGLVAFKILAVGSDPDGGGSVLPNLVIQICSRNEVGPIDEVPLGSGNSNIKLVR